MSGTFKRCTHSLLLNLEWKLSFLSKHKLNKITLITWNSISQGICQKSHQYCYWWPFNLILEKTKQHAYKKIQALISNWEYLALKHSKDKKQNTNKNIKALQSKSPIQNIWPKQVLKSVQWWLICWLDLPSFWIIHLTSVMYSLHISSVVILLQNVMLLSKLPIF